MLSLSLKKLFFTHEFSGGLEEQPPYFPDSGEGFGGGWPAVAAAPPRQNPKKNILILKPFSYPLSYSALKILKTQTNKLRSTKSK